jgi:hypothetical protein
MLAFAPVFPRPIMKKQAQNLLDAASRSAPGKNEPFVCEDATAITLAAQWLSAKERFEAVKELLGTLADQIIALVTPWYGAQCREKGNVPSVLVPAINGEVRVSYPHKYDKIKADREQLLRGILGDDFDTLFTKAYALKVRKEIAEDPAALQVLILALGEALGKAQFVKAFETEQTLHPTAEFTAALTGFDEPLLEKLAEAGVRQGVSVQKAG